MSFSRILFGFVFSLLIGQPVLAVSLQSVPGPALKGPQFVQADRAGNVFFLKIQGLEVYPVEKSGTLGEPEQLQATGAAAGLVRDAAMSLAGDRWFLLGESSVRLFVDGKEKVVPPLEWKPWSLTLLRDVPVVAVVPFPLGGRSVRLKDVGTPPWFVQMGSDRWTAIRELKGVSVAELLQDDRLNDEIASNSVLLSGDREGRLWAARQYGYRVQRFTPNGRQLLEITVRGGATRQKEESGSIEVDLKKSSQNPSDATQNPRSEKGTYTPFTAQRVIYGLTQSRDHRVYLLVSTESGKAALDRYDPARAVLERIPLQGVTLKGAPLSIAAGKDALYIAPWEASEGRWRLEWEQIEAAPWKLVKGAEIDGIEVKPEAPEGKGPQPNRVRPTGNSQGNPGQPGSF